MADKKTCGMCGAEYVGYCGHGTIIKEIEDQEKNFKKVLMEPPWQTTYVCKECQFRYEFDFVTPDYCRNCGGSLGVFDEASAIPDRVWRTNDEADALRSVGVMFDPPCCAVCGECPTAEYLAAQVPDYLCCEPLPIMSPRRSLRP